MKPNKPRQSAMDTLVNGYNSMMKDPLEYAKGTYQSQIRNLGRPYGGDRDARTKANKPWNKGDIPV